MGATRWTPDDFDASASLSTLRPQSQGMVSITAPPPAAVMEASSAAALGAEGRCRSGKSWTT